MSLVTRPGCISTNVVIIMQANFTLIEDIHNLRTLKSKWPPFLNMYNSEWL